MNTSILKEGQIYKNFKLLCEALGIIPKQGKAKVYQVKDIERYCAMSKSGHSIKIDTVYEVPLPKVDGRGKDTIYGDIIQLVFTDYFINSGQSNLILTRNNILEGTNVFNKNYNYASRRVHQLSNYTSISKDAINDFYSVSKGSFKYMVESTLNALRQKSLIMYNKITMIADRKYNHSIATPSERALILEKEKIVIQNMGYKGVHQVIVNDRWEEYRKNVVDLLGDFDIKYYYTAYDIVVNEKFIESDHNDMLLEVSDKIKNEERSTEANRLICARLLDNAIKRGDNVDIESRLYFTRSSFDYTTNNSKLIDLLVRENPDVLLDGVLKDYYN